MPEYTNPNQTGGGQDSRLFTVMILVMFAAIFGYQWWQLKHTPPPEPQHATPAAQSQSASSAAATQGAPTGPATVAEVKATGESTTVVENELYRITFSNHGAQVTSWVLKKYKDGEGHPLDLVHDEAAKIYGYPMSLYTYDATLTQAISQALYVPSATGTLQAPATLSFEYAAGNVTVKKTFSFGADYVVHADTLVTRGGSPVRALLSWPMGLGDMEGTSSFASSQIDTAYKNNDDHVAFKKVTGGATLNGPFDYAGTSDQYFAAIFMPDQPTDATVVTFHDMVDAAQFTKGSRLRQFVTNDKPAKLPMLGAAVGSLSGHNEERVFVGPKAMTVLASVTTATGTSLKSVLDFGFFGPIGKYLFVALHFVQEHVVSNWGWAIILFTLFINIVLLPLRIQSMRSALKMQRIQPELDKIKAKYKNPGPTDPKAAEMNAEIMDYQKSQGVSMFGGCIPSLIQLPLLFAFFTMMTRVVELRQAHWYWLHDLSAADPYHILPIFMVLTSFLVQFYTPSPGVDPQQQRMMAFMMPAFSGWMTWNYASGLALYWNTGNLVMILMQLGINYSSLGKEMKKLAADRAARKSAGPKVIQGKR
ncbi:protein translocase subunit yidC [Bryocella elongata]|uniref:Membrane protein insertase YidC n=1 Tax=Bryocella elongata TaxID=863522 RepID=A0A1H5Y3D4_9BACT|nr:membrane protein insertase YidC [Bryocella elongata]SEG18408.1 protein translocase subunit yidC [Bryocella elongata]